MGWWKRIPRKGREEFSYRGKKKVGKTSYGYKKGRARRKKTALKGGKQTKKKNQFNSSREVGDDTPFCSGKGTKEKKGKEPPGLKKKEGTDIRKKRVGKDRNKDLLKKNGIKS